MLNDVSQQEITLCIMLCTGDDVQIRHRGNLLCKIVAPLPEVDATDDALYILKYEGPNSIFAVSVLRKHFSKISHIKIVILYYVGLSL